MNSDEKMEFPRDMMIQDCLQNSVEPLYGFVTNVTLLTDQPCIRGVECFENGTSINQTSISMQKDTDMTFKNNISDVGPPFSQGHGK